MRPIILIAGLFFSVHVFAQSKEYIVKQNGDTIAGEVIILPKQIKVLKNHVDTITLNSEDVRFYVKDKTAKPVLRLILYGYSDNIEEVQTYNYRNPVYDTTILLTPLITGEKLNLFTGKDKRRVVYFFVQWAGDIKAEQLLYSVGGEMKDKASWGHPYQWVNYVTHHLIFVDQLNEMTKECEAITVGHLRMLEYRESSLKSFVKRYNKNCK
jgi:hypothetical protein